MKWYLDFGHGGKDSGAVSANKTKEIASKKENVIHHKE